MSVQTQIQKGIHLKKSLKIKMTDELPQKIPQKLDPDSWQKIDDAV